MEKNTDVARSRSNGGLGIIKEFEIFNERKHDDYIDALSYLIYLVPRKRNLIAWKILAVTCFVIAIAAWHYYG